jgi:hypothetical protein
MTPEQLLKDIATAKSEATYIIRDMLNSGVPVKHIAAKIGFSTAIVLSVRDGQSVFDGEIACKILINCGGEYA